MNEDILIELGVVSDETKGAQVPNEVEGIDGFNRKNLG